MNGWSAPQRPVSYVEQALVTAILDGSYPPGCSLPGERELAASLGVTRPTLREALRRLESDGWLSVAQGKATRVKDFWREGGLNLLGDLVRYSKELPDGFVKNLLDVRLAMAPAYAREAVEHAAGEVKDFLEGSKTLEDTPQAYASFDWRLHVALTVASKNPIYTLILNGFSGFYEEMARRYFENPEARRSSQAFYADLLEAAGNHDAQAAEAVTQRVMLESIAFWQLTADKNSGNFARPGGMR
jgi:GntR family negative regulator for fad regulon and positive regulator of fabA